MQELIITIVTSSFFLGIGYQLGKREKKSDKFLMYLVRCTWSERIERIAGSETLMGSTAWTRTVVEYAKATFHPKFIDKDGNRL
jgi:hypothetical protein